MDTSEKDFEAAIEAALLRDPLVGEAGGALADAATGAYIPGGYHRRDPADYDKELCLIPKDVVGFISATQPKEWQKMLAQHGADAKPTLLKRLASETHKHGTLHVLRKGIKANGCNKGNKIGERKLLFPRYHQLDCVRRIVADALSRGVGQCYLVQHSAGSGKSNTIAWLAHQLSVLHDTKDERIFDSIVVITDRRVLDRQLQRTVRQFEQTLGVVENIDTTSRQLKQALEDGNTIIVTTLQKFPVIADQAGHRQRRFRRGIPDVDVRAVSAGQGDVDPWPVTSFATKAEPWVMKARVLPDPSRREQTAKAGGQSKTGIAGALLSSAS